MTDHLFTQMEELAKKLRAEDEVGETAEQVVAFALEQFEADYGGITLLQPEGRLETVAPSDPLVELLDRLQYELNEGCCLDSTWTAESIVCESLGTDPRWPSWGAKTAELGVASVLAVALSTRSRHRVGTLSLYFSRPRTFSNDDLAFSRVLGRHAALALSTAMSRDDIDVTLDPRKRIGIAEGMLVERFKIKPDHAYLMLQRYAQDHDEKLHDVVDRLIADQGSATDPAGHDSIS